MARKAWSYPLSGDASRFSHWLLWVLAGGLITWSVLQQIEIHDSRADINSIKTSDHLQWDSIIALGAQLEWHHRVAMLLAENVLPYRVDGDVIGTMFYVGNGLYLTANHVASVGLPDGAVLVSRDVTHDLAVIRLDGAGGQGLKLAERDPAPGDLIMSLGWQTGTGVFSCGIYNGIQDSGHWSFTLDSSPGSSGSPVLNKRGEVIGMVTQIRLYRGQAVWHIARGPGVTAIRRLLEESH